MSLKASYALRGRNPDVLTCIANLSNDEVFTPPEFANRMLDTLAAAWAADHGGANLWADKRVRFLDPCTKSGVFLREITRRLTQGLAAQMPDLQERVNHILTQQVFGMGVTRLTSMLARRSVYCSKHAQGPHSIGTGFASDAGNIWFERTEHTWDKGKCVFCAASQSALDRGETLETHAYAFIHTDNIKTRIVGLFGDTMQFDVIIGNPPYQLNDGGFGTSAAPIYQLFVEQAKALAPRYLSMIIPARWFAGGKGLDEFRETMLADKRLRSLDDYLSAADVFPGVGLKGGVCYFLWNRDQAGTCQVTTHFKDWSPSSAQRWLSEEGADVFIRFNEGLSILKKVMAIENGKPVTLSLPESKRFDHLVSSRKPFGLETTFKGRASEESVPDSLAPPDSKRFDQLVSTLRPFGLRTFFRGNSKKVDGDVLVYQNGGTGYIARSELTTGTHLIDHWKIFIGRAALRRARATGTAIRTRLSALPLSVSRAAFLQKPIFASAPLIHAVRLKAPCPIWVAALPVC